MWDKGELMTTHLPTVKVAVVQAAPVLFDRDATVAKTCRLAAEAAAEGAKLILLPEAFIPAYPRGLTFGTVIGSRSAEGRRTWERYWANSVVVPSPATEALGAAARQAGAYLAVGVVERDGEFSGGTLYCTTLYFGPDGSLLGNPPSRAPPRRRDSGSASTSCARSSRRTGAASTSSRAPSAGRPSGSGCRARAPRESRQLTGRAGRKAPPPAPDAGACPCGLRSPRTAGPAARAPRAGRGRRPPAPPSCSFTAGVRSTRRAGCGSRTVLRAGLP